MKAVAQKLVIIEDYLVIAALVLAGITFGTILFTKTPNVSAGQASYSSYTQN